MFETGSISESAEQAKEIAVETVAGPKRFYTDAAIEETGAGWTVTLDGRPIRTPARAAFVAPQAVAAAAAEEWRAQVETIDPTTMPTTRAVNTAIDRIALHRSVVIDEIAGYGGSDLLCYRAEGPGGLVAREAAVWDPVVAWAKDTLGAEMVCVSGVVHAAQPEASLVALRSVVAAQSDLGLAALHELTTLSGSLLLALAVDRRLLTAEAAWAASRVDEDWQIEQWGRDTEADRAAERRWRDFSAAARLIALLD